MWLNLPNFKRPRHSSESKSVVNLNNEGVKDRAFTDFDFFVREFFPHHAEKEFSQMHRDFCQIETEPDLRGVNRVTAAPRGNAKTTFRVIFKSLHAIVYGYHPFIIIIGYSESEAIDKVKDIRDELVMNERLIEVYGRLASAKSAKSDFITSNNVRIVARGRGGQVRGLKHGPHRPSLIILDDIESLEGVNTPEQRLKTENWFFKDVMGARSADGKTNVEFVGTILHEEALLPTLLKKPGWKSSKYKAILSWPENQNLWEQWREVYRDLDNVNAEADALAFFKKNEKKMMQGVKVLWPAGETFYDLMKYDLQYGRASLLSEKQNEPFDPERQILNPDLCPRFKVYRPGDPEWLESLGEDGFALVRLDTGKAVHSRDLKVIGFLDPALGDKKQKKTTQLDFAAVVVCAQDPSGYVYALDCWMKKQAPNQQIQACFAMHEKWGLDTMYLETVGFQELMKDTFKEIGKLYEGAKFRVVGVDQHKNKVARIATMEPYFSNRWLLLNQVIDHELINQLRLFPTGHDDGPDALHGCVSRLRRPKGAIQPIPQEGGLL